MAYTWLHMVYTCMSSTFSYGPAKACEAEMEYSCYVLCVFCRDTAKMLPSTCIYYYFHLHVPSLHCSYYGASGGIANRADSCSTGNQPLTMAYKMALAVDRLPSIIRTASMCAQFVYCVVLHATSHKTCASLLWFLSCCCSM
jgi:hypothetical protein